MLASAKEEPTARTVSPRAAGVSGLVFVVLLLIGAGMATVPGAEATTSAVRTFYEQHRGVVVVAQLVELVATVPLLVFTMGLARSTLVTAPRQVARAGIGIALAAVATAVPPLVLCVVAGSVSAASIDALALLSDMVDVLLFLTIAVFSGMCARHWLGAPWARWAAMGVTLVCALRAGEIVLRGSELELVSPSAFVLFVIALSVCLLRRDRQARV
jgi:hypothetical protein